MPRYWTRTSGSVGSAPTFNFGRESHLVGSGRQRHEHDKQRRAAIHAQVRSSSAYYVALEIQTSGPDPLPDVYG
jgi:hypothetical protein